MPSKRDQPAEPGLLGDIREALAAGGALDLLTLASGLLAVSDPRQRDPFAPDAPTGPSRQELLESFLEVDRPETSALLAAVVPMLDDEVAARRIKRELARRDRLPDAVARLAPIEVGTPVRMSHVLGDGDSYLLPARTAGGEHLTALVYVDHNMGTVVKDAFVVPATLDEALVPLHRGIGDDPDTTIVEVDAASVRAIVTEAIDSGARTYPPFETETWPLARPLIEWLVGQLPAGGEAPERREWSDDDREALMRRFLDSPHGASHDGETAIGRLHSLLWYACDYGTGDPLRWSEPKVEILLTDWLPRKVVASVHRLEGVPDLLRDFVRFAHGEAGIRQSLTDDTLRAIDRWEPDYQQLIRSPHSQGVDALMETMGFLDDADTGSIMSEYVWDEAIWVDAPWEESALARLAEQVGGHGVLLSLDTAPLPDEMFDRSVVPDDPGVAARVDEVGALLDRACQELFDVEHRTACRRLLADLVTADAGVLVRGRAETAAAALAWLVAKANDSFGSYSAGLTVAELSDWFGLKSTASQRAGTFLRALDLPVPYGSASWASLGSPRYLTSARRRSIVEVRDRLESSLRPG